MAKTPRIGSRAHFMWDILTRKYVSKLEVVEDTLTKHDRDFNKRLHVKNELEHMLADIRNRRRVWYSLFKVLEREDGKIKIVPRIKSK